MQKSVRSLALAAALTLSAVPALHANQTGCNPHPPLATTASGSFLSYVHLVLSFFGA